MSLLEFYFLLPSSSLSQTSQPNTQTCTIADTELVVTSHLICSSSKLPVFTIWTECWALFCIRYWNHCRKQTAGEFVSVPIFDAHAAANHLAGCHSTCHGKIAEPLSLVSVPFSPLRLTQLFPTSRANVGRGSGHS